jgi:hypothetical protein
MLKVAAAITQIVNEKPFRKSEELIPARRKTKKTPVNTFASVSKLN